MRAARNGKERVVGMMLELSDVNPTELALMGDHRSPGLRSAGIKEQ